MLKWVNKVPKWFEYIARIEEERMMKRIYKSKTEGRGYSFERDGEMMLQKCWMAEDNPFKRVKGVYQWSSLE